MSAVFALHGFTGSPLSWHFIKDATSGALVAPALLGHAGASESPEVRDFDAEVSRLAAQLPSDAAVHVTGYSLGARLALGIALRYPERVQQLTLFSAHPGLESHPEREARRTRDAAWAELLTTRGLAAFVAAWEAQPLWDSQARVEPARLEQKRVERLSHSAQGLARSLRVVGLSEMPDYGRELGSLRIPVHFVAGALDVKFRELAHAMAERTPRARVSIVPGAGHDLLLECPERVVQLLDAGAER